MRPYHPNHEHGTKSKHSNTVARLTIPPKLGCSKVPTALARLQREVVQQYHQQVRRLRPSEQRGLLGELRLAAIRFAASRMKDFSLPRAEGSVAERRFLDPADFFERLDLIEGLGDRGVRQALGLQGRP